MDTGNQGSARRFPGFTLSELEDMLRELSEEHTDAFAKSRSYLMKAMSKEIEARKAVAQ